MSVVTCEDTDMSDTKSQMVNECWRYKWQCHSAHKEYPPSNRICNTTSFL